MDKRLRRLVFIGFFLVFVIIAPIIILHTSGYRFDWLQKRLFKTSLISVNTEPRGATVVLNGVIQSKKTPVFLSDLLPGTYSIQLTMNGFLPWQESVTVQSRRATVLGTIDLIADQSPQVLITRNVIQVSPTANLDAAFVLSQTENNLTLERIALPSGTVQNLGEYSSDTRLLTEPFEDRILITSPDKTSSRIYLVDAKTSLGAQPLDFITEDLRQWQWISNNELMGLSDNGLCSVRIAEQKIDCQPLASSSFWIANKSLYYLTHDDKTTYLYYAKNRDIHQAELIARLPLSDQYRLVSDNPKIPVLIDVATQDLYTMNLKDSLTSLVRLPKAAKAAAWNRDHSQLLYYNDYEMSTWQPDDDMRTLLTRVSTPISTAAWCGDYPHIAMSSVNKLSLLDSQTSPAASIALADNVGDWLTVDPDGRWVIYLINHQSQSSLWLRRLHE